MTVFQTPIGNIDSEANRDIVGNLFSSGDGGGIAVCLLIDTSSPLGILPTSPSASSSSSSLVTFGEEGRKEEIMHWTEGEGDNSPPSPFL